MKTRFFYVKPSICAILILTEISLLNLQAQDYLISFAGSGESISVDSVRIENLTQGTKLEMKGSEILHLMGVVTGIETPGNNEAGIISFYPNPMDDHTRMQFALPDPGKTLISLYDISGRKIAQVRDLLSKGQHIYGIQGVEEGIYFITINSGKYFFSSRLICTGSQISDLKIVHENSVAIREKQSDSKGINNEKVMQYTTGDILKLTGITGIYSTIMTVVPAANKTITFNFIACTDGDGNNYPVVQITTAKGSKDNQNSTEITWTLMGVNLNTTKFIDGTNITITRSSTDWKNANFPALCYLYDISGYGLTYGALYNWYAVTDSHGLCPTGWHVPTIGEWQALAENLGGADIAGGKLKETGTAHWMTPNVGATNSTGLTALPGGFRDSNGTSNQMRNYGFWWSSTGLGGGQEGAVYFYLYYNDAQAMTHEAYTYNRGYSVRCAKF